jgi:hypothetical protein
MHPGQPLLRLKQSHNPHNHLVNFNDEGLLVCVFEICYEVELFSVGQLSLSLIIWHFNSNILKLILCYDY